MSTESITFEQSLQRLDEIVRRMEKGDVPLEEALSLFEEGTRLAGSCSRLLDEAGLRAPVLDSLQRAVERHLVRRAAGAYRVGAVLFSNEYGLLGRTASAAEMLAEWKGKKQ